MTGKENVIENILDQMTTIFQNLLPLAHQELLELDMTAPQLKVVMLLYINEAERMTDLARQLGVTLATATGIIDRLVEKGIVVRENKKDDRRVVMCVLTSKGRELTSHMWDSTREKIRQILNNLDSRRLILIEESINDLIIKNQSLNIIKNPPVMK